MRKCVNRKCRAELQTHGCYWRGLCSECACSQRSKYGLLSEENVRISREQAAKIKRSPSAQESKIEALYVSTPEDANLAKVLRFIQGEWRESK